METDKDKGAKIGGIIFEALDIASRKARAYLTNPLGRSATDTVLNGLANSAFYLINKLRSDMTQEDRVQAFLKHFQASVESVRQ